MAPLTTSFRLQRRSSSSINPIYIAGFCVAGFIAVCVLGVLAYRWKNKKSAQEGDQEGSQSAEAGSKNALEPAFKSATFSRSNLTQSIILPSKSLSTDEVIAHHVAQGNLPQPFRPFSFALNAGSALPIKISEKKSPLSRSSSAFSLSDDSPFSDPGSIKESAGHKAINSFDSHSLRPIAAIVGDRNSRRGSVMSSIRNSVLGGLGFGSGNLSVRFSVISNNNSHLRTGSGSSLSVPGSRPISHLSHVSSLQEMQEVKVRQLFTPILPDEPVMALSEKVTVVQRFDDGWCVIARRKPFSPAGSDEVELGSVPVFCFEKPVKGVKAERPVRSTSLGVTVQMDSEVPRPRDDIISWSNF